MVKPPMTPVDPNQEALFREIDEDLRHERLASLWARYGGHVLAGVVLLVGGVAAGQGWQAWQARERAAAAAAYEAADSQLAAGDRAGAEAALTAIAQDRRGGVVPLAILRRAALLAQDGKTAEAVALYQGLAADHGVDPVFRDTARVLAVSHGLDLLDATTVDSLLAPLRGGAGPWRPLAEELAALVALKKDDRDTAVTLLSGLAADRLASQGLRQRAAGMLEALGAPVPEALPGAGDGGAR
ncbi:tetratricopeptide repeat protein [Pararhodospirillum photometricum]|uniref:Ancillary SecYEG translocon subunit/Cell division coordinator CpoB TPR domain-containing protein n=1 Tax=Pararhodospirillum photometricum DSM 122 TaxID=1150469 RepID=H6SMH6_PARPM|nr:tetratricopeptide repeat protein [Pararhodospirillum photometricum]CCG09111.1 Putative uncharacterized protein [Pararhodospirillum photometricum DSM 122]